MTKEQMKAAAEKSKYKETKIPENVKPKTEDQKEEKKVISNIPKGEKKVFSFRSDPENVKRWRAYAKAKIGMTPDELGTLAIEEYISNHALVGAEKRYFEDSMK